MREIFNKLWKGMLLAAFMVICLPQVAEATEVLDVPATGLVIDYETPESTYKAGSGTVSWKPAVVDGEGNVTSPAVLTFNNATITTQEGLVVEHGTDVTVEVLGTNRISCTDGVAFYVASLDDAITVTITGNGTLDMETVSESFGMIMDANLCLTGGVTVSMPETSMMAYDLTVDNAKVLCGVRLVVTGALHVKSGIINTEEAYLGTWSDGDVIIDKGATLNAGFIGLYGELQNAGEVNAVVSTDEAVEKMTVYGDIILDADGSSMGFISASDIVVISEGATLTVPEGVDLDLSVKGLEFAADSSLVVEGAVTLPPDTTADDIAEMNLTGDGVVVVAGASDAEETIYTTEGKELNVVSGLDFTNVGTDDGQTAATGDGYTWDATTKTLTLSAAYIGGSLNLPTGSKVVVNGINIVTGDVMVAGTVSDAFTISGEGKLNTVSKKYASHIYKEPTFTWTATKDGYTAKATFVCLGGEDIQTIDAKVTATTTDASYTSQGKVVYEAKVTFNGKDYTDSKEIIIPKNELLGLQIEDAKTKAIYKVTGVTATGGTVEYVKHKRKTVKTVIIPKTITMDGLTFKVTSISAKAFKGYRKLSKVTIGNNVKTIGKEAFSECKKLKTVKMGNNIKTIGDKAFYKCIALTRITIPAKVSKIGKSAFEKCKKLKTVTIESKKLTAKKIGAKAFKDIYSTANIMVPRAKMKAYRTMLYKKGVDKKANFKKI